AFAERRRDLRLGLVGAEPKRSLSGSSPAAPATASAAAQISVHPAATDGRARHRESVPAGGWRPDRVRSADALLRDVPRRSGPSQLDRGSGHGDAGSTAPGEPAPDRDAKTGSRGHAARARGALANRGRLQSGPGPS